MNIFTKFLSLFSKNGKKAQCSQNSFSSRRALSVDELRSLYVDFFKQKGHTIIPSSSLIPENDPTVLFTTAGMHPLVPYILGQKHPSGDRLTDYQKCVRTGDIDSVGDSSHLTFFEMLGNWSLGAYFKKEMIGYSYEFLTKVLNINPKDLYVTVFQGDEDAPRDDEAAECWQEAGLDKSHIFFLPKSDNWWGPAGESGPCGPDSEMFIDTGKPKCSPSCKPGCSCGKYLEIWNDVFMQYNKLPTGQIVPMDRKCIDTGMGIERTIAILNGKKSVYDIPPFQKIITEIQRLGGAKYGQDEKIDTSIRIIADHIRTAVFILGDTNHVSPSNVGAGYILRRLIRRSVRHAHNIGIDKPFLSSLADVVIDLYKAPYPELEQNVDFIHTELLAEERKFNQTLENGEKEFEKTLENLKKGNSKTIPGRIAFRLYDTYGFPLELTQELASENGLSVDKAGFDEAFLKHQELSRAGAGVFKSGLQDNSEKTTAHHTATHLLHKALCDVLGGYVKQMGSNITAERLRFDFNHDKPLTKEELQSIEDLVNKKIGENLEVKCDTMTIDEAREKGAFAQFDAKYGDSVSVYSIGDYSKEVCAGPHVKNTGTMGHFKILKESSSSSGVRRIKAVLEDV